MTGVSRTGGSRGVSPLGQDMGAAPAAAPQALPLAPLGVFGRTPRAPGQPGAVVGARVEEQGAPTRVAQLRAAFDAFLAGEEPALEAADLKALQVLALDTAQARFTNEFGNDGEIKRRLGEKQDALAPFRLDEQSQREVLAGRENKPLDALQLLLRTFRSPGGSDSALRQAIFHKLGDMGRRRDIAAILPHVRKGDASDLFHGLEAIKAITRRTGSPQERGKLHQHPIAGPLLRKERLTDEERMRLSELVLAHGTISRIDKLGHGNNRNDVFFVTFAERIPGADGQRREVRGVFKPERTWVGKSDAYFPREVAAYEFDRSFAKSGLVPPTVEAVIALGDRQGCEVGSMQLMIQDAKPLGDWGFENGVGRWRYQREFEALKGDPAFERQLAKARVLAYVLKDADKFASNVRTDPNLANFMVDQSGKLWLIDNAYSQGAGPQPDRSLLPQRKDGKIVRRLERASSEAVSSAMAEFIQDHNASEVARRVQVAVNELKHRPDLE